MPASDQDVEGALSRWQAALDKIRSARVDKSIGSMSSPIVRAASARWIDAREERQRASQECARVRFDHAADINQVVRQTPDFIPRSFERHLPGMPASLERIHAEWIVVDRIFNRGANIRPNPCLGTQPLILDAASTWFAGDTRTVTGMGFGPNPGIVVLELTVPAGTVIPLTVISWSDTAAMVRVPTILPPSIPLHAQGNFRITRTDVDCTDSVSITFEPPSTLLVSRQSKSAAGGHTPPYTYRKDWTLTSPVIPPRAELFDGAPDLLPLGDVLLKLSSSEYSDSNDDPPSVSVKSGPSFTSNHERTLTVTVTDDYLWDYTVTADFLIVQPDDETVIAGWFPV